MPKIRLAQPFDDFHGTVSGQTVNNRMVLSSSRREANTGRAWKAPNNPRSFRQTEVRKYMTLASAAYRDLDQAVADDWTDAANAHNRTNILGLDYNLTGIGLFLMLNMYRQIAGHAIAEELPDFFMPPIPIAVTKAVRMSGTVFRPTIDITGLETAGKVFIRVSPPLPGQARRARSNQCRMLDINLSNNVYQRGVPDLVTMTLAMPMNYMAVGDRIGIEVRSLSALYWPGPPLLVPNIEVLPQE